MKYVSFIFSDGSVGFGCLYGDIIEVLSSYVVDLKVVIDVGILVMFGSEE